MYTKHPISPPFERLFMKKTLILCISLTLFTGCPADDTKGNDSSASASPETKASSVVTKATAPPKDPAHHPSAVSHPKDKDVTRGIIIMTEGFATFKPCNTPDYVWLYDKDNNVQAKYNGLQLAEMEPAYVELKGSTKAISIKDGAEADYKQAFTVKEIVNVSKWEKTPCFKEEISGEGADWNLHVIKGDEVLFKDGKSEFPLVESLAYSPGKDGVYTFKYNTPNPDQLEVKLTTEACKTNGKTFSHKAEIDFHGDQYTGCANLNT